MGVLVFKEKFDMELYIFITNACKRLQFSQHHY